MIGTESSTAQRHSMGRPLGTAAILAGIWALFQWLVPMTPTVRGAGWFAMAVLVVLLIRSLQYRWLTPFRRAAGYLLAVGLVGLAAWSWWPETVSEFSADQEAMAQPVITQTSPPSPTAKEIAEELAERQRQTPSRPPQIAMFMRYAGQWPGYTNRDRVEFDQSIKLAMRVGETQVFFTTIAGSERLSNVVIDMCLPPPLKVLPSAVWEHADSDCQRRSKI